MPKTVKVPSAYEALFEQAEKQVKAFFSEQYASPTKGTIDIHGSRYVLVRGAAFSVEFFQLVRKIFGEDNQQDADLFSSSLLYELAHAVGRSDAKNFHSTMGLSDPVEKLSAGPVHFAYSGWASVNILEESNPSPDDDFCLIYKHPYSFECDAWLSSDSSVDHPVCIMNAGYSSGWCQQSFNIPLEARELTCRSQGSDDCLFIMAQPDSIEQKIQNYLENHPEVTVADEQLAFQVDKDLLFGQGEEEAVFRSSMRQRLLAYARRLEGMQMQLSDNVEQLTREIEERKRVEKTLQESELRWRELSNATFDAIITLQDDRVMSANPATEKLLSRSINDILGANLSQLFNSEECVLIEQAIQQKKSELLNVRLFHQESEKFVDIHCHYSTLNLKPSIILAIKDITEQAIAMQRLERLANYDSLTGLPNRTRFQAIVNRSLMDSGFSDCHGMLFLDLDDFKSVNDSYGHSAGDHLLYEIAQRMTAAIRGMNTICRLGGDEFAVWIPDIKSKSDAKAVAEQLLKALNQPIEISRQKIDATFSIGIAIYPKDGSDYSTLSRHSDKAMYTAKRAGKNGYSFYSSETSDE